ncbi:hypothetical protein [Sphingobacterium sp. MYb382]|uniref:hypothetical protein n=1 Tax=Sphingobacterium sp. MYb382 TaxID=2745278 RepID=UPI00309CB852
MKIKYSLIALVLFIASCKKDNVVDLDTEGEQRPIVNTRTILMADVGLKNSTLQQEKHSLLGYGFDAKEKTIYVINGLRNIVINMETLSDREYGVVTSSSGEGFHSNNLTKKEVLSLLKLTSTESTNPSYQGYDFKKMLPDSNITFVNEIVVDRNFRLYRDLKLTSKNYNEDFKNAVVKLSPEELVKQFGTHIISDFYQGFFYVGISFMDNETYSDDAITRNRQNLIFAAGSDISSITTTNDVINFGGYGKNYRRENSQFVGFGNLERQVPLYELLEQGEKRDALKKYIEAYLK